MSFVEFLNAWQNLIGAFVGAFIAISGAFLLNLWLRHQDKVGERKRLFANLLLILHDLQLFITRCEAYLIFKKNQKVSFNKIVIQPAINYIEASQQFDLHPEAYNAIQLIYSVANVIKYNLDKSEVVKTLERKDADGNRVHIQENIISSRYWNALAFVEHYLEDIYHNFNFVALEVKKLSRRYKYLKFPDTIKLYKKEYVNQKIKEFNLQKGKLSGY